MVIVAGVLLYALRVFYFYRYPNCDSNLEDFEPPCSHKEGRYKCQSIPMYLLAKAKNLVYAIPNKIEQGRRLSHMLKVTSPKLRRTSKHYEGSRSRTSIVVSYEVKTGDQTQPVCSKFFQRLFGISQTRLNSIAKAVKGGEGVKEKRGGNRKRALFAAKKKCVCEFIGKLKARESHYNRSKSQRLYLSPDLSINKLLKVYNVNAPAQLKVKKWFFQNIYRTKFNIGFGSPATDSCSYCARMTFQIKNTTDNERKNHLLAHLGGHKLCAKTFHKLMRERSAETRSFWFDLLQVQPLPKLSTGEAYYCRQISFYALCVTDIRNNNATFFTWNEAEGGRGANEVASGVLSYLEEAHLEDSVTNIRLFADGCGGQNKNMHVIHALVYWLQKKAPTHLKNITAIFPVRGHSYLPADRLFGVVEKALRKCSDFLTPEEYREVYKSAGKVRALGHDWSVRDYKILAKKFRQLDGIKEMKRVMLKKCTINGKPLVRVKMEPTYRSDDPSKHFVTILKRGTNMEQVSEPPVIDHLRALSDAKKLDIDTILKAKFSDNWREIHSLQMYKLALDFDAAPECCDPKDCNCLEEETRLSRL